MRSLFGEDVSPSGLIGLEQNHLVLWALTRRTGLAESALHIQYKHTLAQPRFDELTQGGVRASKTFVYIKTHVRLPLLNHDWMQEKQTSQIHPEFVETLVSDAAETAEKLWPLD